MAAERRHSEQWEHWVATTPVTRVITRAEAEEWDRNAGPPTDDDVPWRFPVRAKRPTSDGRSAS